jgi:asparagine synthase (glutamine-hydrolysing)
MQKKIFLNTKNWYKYTSNNIEILYKGVNAKKNCLKLVQKLNKEKNLTKLTSHINFYDNNFAIIIKKNEEIFAIVDKIRSYPLLYYYDNNNFILFENYQLIKNISLNKIVDKKQVLYFSLSGYTFQNGTIYKNIKQINPGTLIHFVSNKVNKFKYHSFNDKIVKKISNSEQKLKSINEEIILKLIKSCKGKQIVIPLSAGYDSRFVLSGLKEYGFDNILTFSYGRKNNREVKIAKALSKKLKVPWHYISYTNKNLKAIVESKEHQSYEAFADNLTSIHFPQDFTAIKYLHENDIISKNSVIVNGQSGDFISGNHLPTLDYKNKNVIKDLVSLYTSKNYNLWNKYYLKNKSKLNKYILTYIKLNIPNFNKKKNHTLYEILEFENRQCKYVVNGQRLYEFFNYEWRLPLWDDLYLDFWATVPQEEKLNQKLYKETLHNTNWCGVWNSIPINPKNSFSLEVKFLRLFFKSFFLFCKKESWHLFERRYLNYFIDPLCGYAQWNFTKIISDKKKFRNSLSWETEKYLNKKKIPWESLI